MCGLVYLRVPPETFLQSFRESMVRKSDSAILEIGRFSSAPTIYDLQSLTLEPGDIDDLKTRVAGDCNVKLSAEMMQRFQNEIDWTAPNYHSQVTLLFKNILLDYVREYLRQGDAALIEYNDKSKGIRLADETQSLIRGRASEFPGTEYDQDPSLPFSVTFVSPRTDCVFPRARCHSVTVIH